MAQAGLSLQNLQAKMAALQEKMEQAIKHEQQLAALDYQGPNYKIKVQISDKVYVTSSKVLFSNKHGKTNLFLQQLQQLQGQSSSFNIAANDPNTVVTDSKIKGQLEGTNNNEEKGQDAGAGAINIKPPGQPPRVNEIFFDRNPALFQYILDYMRGYTSDTKLKLFKLSNEQLVSLMEDCIYYQLRTLYEMVNNIYENKFDHIQGSPLIKLEKYWSVAVRSNNSSGSHVSVPVNKAMYLADAETRSATGDGVLCRYVEFNIASNNSRTIMIGVTEADAYKVGQFAGSAYNPGFSVYANNGHLYTGSSEQWLAGACNYGDKIGMMIRLNARNKTATLQYFHNRKKVKGEIDIKKYMSIDNGIVFNVALCTHLDAVQIVQNAKAPE